MNHLGKVVLDILAYMEGTVACALTKAAQRDDLEARDGSFLPVPATWRPQLLLHIAADATRERNKRMINDAGDFMMSQEMIKGDRRLIEALGLAS